MAPRAGRLASLLCTLHVVSVVKGLLGRALGGVERKLFSSSSSSATSSNAARSTNNNSKPFRAPRVGARLADVNTQHVALIILVAVVVAPFMEYRGTPGQTVQAGMLSLLAPLGEAAASASSPFSRAALEAEIDGFFDFFINKQRNPLMVPKIVTVGAEVFDRTGALGPLPRRAADVHTVVAVAVAASSSSSSSSSASATFDTSGANRRAAVLSLALSALVVAWVSAAAAGLGRSAARLVIGPVERVLAALRRDAGAVLDAVDGGNGGGGGSGGKDKDGAGASSDGSALGFSASASVTEESKKNKKKWSSAAGAEGDDSADSGDGDDDDGGNGELRLLEAAVAKLSAIVAHVGPAGGLRGNAVMARLEVESTDDATRAWLGTMGAGGGSGGSGRGNGNGGGGAAPANAPAANAPAQTSSSSSSSSIPRTVSSVPVPDVPSLLSQASLILDASGGTADLGDGSGRPSSSSAASASAAGSASASGRSSRKGSAGASHSSFLASASTLENQSSTAALLVSSVREMELSDENNNDGNDKDSAAAAASAAALVSSSSSSAPSQQPRSQSVATTSTASNPAASAAAAAAQAADAASLEAALALVDPAALESWAFDSLSLPASPGSSTPLPP